MYRHDLTYLPFLPLLRVYELDIPPPLFSDLNNNVNRSICYYINLAGNNLVLPRTFSSYHDDLVLRNPRCFGQSLRHLGNVIRRGVTAKPHAISERIAS